MAMLNFFKETQEQRVKQLLEQARTNRDAYNSAITLLKTLNQDPKNNALVKRGIELVRKIVWSPEQISQIQIQTGAEDLTKTLESLGNLDYRVVTLNNTDISNKT